VVDPTGPLSHTPLSHRGKMLMSDRASSMKQMRTDVSNTVVEYFSEDEDDEEDDDEDDNIDGKRCVINVLMYVQKNLTCDIEYAFYKENRTVEYRLFLIFHEFKFNKSAKMIYISLAHFYKFTTNEKLNITVSIFNSLIILCI